jgi:hypothetical protein
MGGLSGATVSGLQSLGGTEALQNFRAKIESSLKLSEVQLGLLGDLVIGVGDTCVSSAVFDKKSFFESLKRTALSATLACGFSQAGKIISAGREDSRIVTGVSAGDAESSPPYLDSQPASAEREIPTEVKAKDKLQQRKQSIESDAIHINASSFPNDPMLTECCEHLLNMTQDQAAKPALPITFETRDEFSLTDVLNPKSELSLLGLATLGVAEQIDKVGKHTKDILTLDILKKANQQASRIGKYN